MAKKTTQKETKPVVNTLSHLLNTSEDMDTILYRLAEIAVRKRDAAEAEPKVNKAEVAYWQKVIVILHDAEEKISSL